MPYQRPENSLLPPVGAEETSDDIQPLRTSGSDTLNPTGTPRYDEKDLGERAPELKQLEQEDPIKFQQAAIEEFKVAAAVEAFLTKFAGVENEPAVDLHPSTPQHKLRPRAEMIPFDEEGVWCIDKGDYLLFPGGGIDDGELPVVAACRETMEEADIHPINVQPHGQVEAVWPLDSGNAFWDDSEFDGERTYFFLCLHGGKTSFDHPDREKFRRMPFPKARQRLRELIEDRDQAWAKRNNQERLALVREAGRLARVKANLKPIKVADVAELKPVSEYLLFTPDGKLVVRKRKNKRIGLPLSGVGEPVRYNETARLIPSEGVPEEGRHGYAVDLYQGETTAAPEGYTTEDPQQVLQKLYASIGDPANRDYRALDRLRARAILRELRRRGSVT